MQLRLRFFWPPKLLQPETQDNRCAEGPLPVTSCCLSWSRSSHLSPGPPLLLPTHFSIPWSSISYPLGPTVSSVHELHQVIPFQKPCEKFCFCCTHGKSQSLCMTVRAWMVRPLPVPSDSSHDLESSQSFLSGSVTFPHLCQPGLPSCPSPASSSLGVSINVASSESPLLTTLSKWNSSAFHSAKLVHSLLSS